MFSYNNLQVKTEAIEAESSAAVPDLSPPPQVVVKATPVSPNMSLRRTQEIRFSSAAHSMLLKLSREERPNETRLK